MSRTAEFVLANPKGFEKMCADMKEWITKSAIDTVNIQSYIARNNVIAREHQDFTLRNTFTVRQTQVTPMSRRTVNSLDEVQATVGITEKASYMARQDAGGYHTPESGSRLAIPTDKARTGKDKKKPVARKYRMNTINHSKVTGKAKHSSKKARGVARAFIAYKEKKVIHYGKNLFSVTEFKKSGDGISFKIEELYKMTETKTYTSGKDYFLPECQKAAADSQSIFNSQMDKNNHFK